MWWDVSLAVEVEAVALDRVDCVRTFLILGRVPEKQGIIGLA